MDIKYEQLEKLKEILDKFKAKDEEELKKLQELFSCEDGQNLSVGRICEKD